MVWVIEGVQSVLMEDWSDDYANSDHWLKYWNAVSAPSNNDWPEGWTKDGDKLLSRRELNFICGQSKLSWEEQCFLTPNCCRRKPV